jgi:hypothetical protein
VRTKLDPEILSADGPDHLHVVSFAVGHAARIASIRTNVTGKSNRLLRQASS